VRKPRRHQPEGAWQDDDDAPLFDRLTQQQGRHPACTAEGGTGQGNPRCSVWNPTSATRQRQARDASWSCGNQPAYHSMINRRSVPALHRACLHQHRQPETKRAGRKFAWKPIENGHDRRNEAPVACPPWIYTNRNLVERFWSRVKEWRAVATRYEKTERSFMGVLCMAATMDWLKA
jgi:transposase